MPQLIGILPSPDDKVPKYLTFFALYMTYFKTFEFFRYNVNTNLLSLNKVKIASNKISSGAVSILLMLKRFRLISLEVTHHHHTTNYEFNNLTMTNFILLFTGPTTEKRLTLIILGIQSICSVLMLSLYYYIKASNFFGALSRS